MPTNEGKCTLLWAWPSNEISLDVLDSDHRYCVDEMVIAIMLVMVIVAIMLTVV